MSRGGILTATDQLIWTQRIEKEKGVNTKVNPDGFSVLAAIRSVDVPRRFKPGHSDPTKPPPDEGFKPGSKMKKEFDFRLKEQAAPRRDRYLWPDTSYQVHGWYQKDPAHGPEKRGRTTIAGALPTCNGIGWRDRIYENKVYKKLAPGGLETLDPANDDKEYVEKPPVTRPQDRKPFAFISPEAVQKALAKGCESGHEGAARGGAHAGADRRSQSLGVLGSATDPTPKALMEASGTKVIAAQRAISEGRLGVMATGSKIQNPDDHICTESFDAAMARHRIFMSRNPKYKWYVPLGNSDVSAYVDNYTKCFGLQYYSKSAQKGTR
jgi:hypothetical protein